MVICVKQRYYRLKEVRFLRLFRKIGVAGQTYYRWRKEYGSLSVDQAKRLKEVEKENTRLRKLVADLSLDKAILKEVAEGKY